MSQTETKSGIKKALPYLIAFAVLAGLVLASRTSPKSGTTDVDTTMKQAIELSTKAIEKYDKGDALTDVETSDLKKAIPEFRKLTTLQPNNWHPYFALGKIYRILGDDPSAEPMFEECIKRADQEKHEQLINFAKSTSSESRFQLSEIAQAKGNIEQSLKLANEAAKQVPTSPPYHTQKAAALWEMKKVEEARNELRIALKLDPKYPKAVTLQKFMLSSENPGLPNP